MTDQDPRPDPEPDQPSGDRRQHDRRQGDRQRRPPKQQTWFPHPPPIKSTPDFIVIVFAITVATILVLLTAGVMLAAIFGDLDIKPYFAVLSSIMTSMISALVGYLAGKNSSHQDGPGPAA